MTEFPSSCDKHEDCISADKEAATANRWSLHQWGSRYQWRNPHQWAIFTYDFGVIKDEVV